MKKMSFFLLFIFSFTTFAYSEESSQYTYGGIQTIGGLPLTGVGWRMKNEHHGVDFSTSVLPLNAFHPVIFHAKSQYLFYPIAKKGLYAGVGLGLFNEPETINGVTGSFEPSIGYEWYPAQKVHIFVEANGILPFKTPEGSVSRAWPGISFGIGF